MQFKAIFAIFITAVVAQDFSGVPECGRSCFADSIPLSGCTKVDDYACLCQSEKYNDAVVACVAKSCDKTDDKREARKWAKKKCKEAGHPI